jgi:Ran GTPase-activating protein (RanGAP) involved in mRNA processing and transport
LVGDNELGDAGATILCDALRESTVTEVQELDLSDNNIGPEGAKAVAAMAAVVASLRSIDLSENVLCGMSTDRRGVVSGTFTAEGITALADALRVCASVTSLSLGDNDLGDAGVEALSIGLKESKSLKTLDLSNRNESSNKFGPRGAMALASAIAVIASSLTKILVGGNNLGDEGATFLCDALRESTVTKVQELDLRYNGIGPEGAKAVAAIAAIVASVTKLTLWKNNLGGEGKAVLRKALEGRSGFKLEL